MPRERKPPPPPEKAAVQPARAPTGLPQGEHQALVQSQQAVPVPDVQSRIQQAIAASQEGMQQGMGALMGDGASLAMPTQRPDEPVQTGLPMGPGAGPGAIQAPAVPAQLEDAEMAKFLPMLEILADQPSATNATRNFVRRLRGTMPPQVTMGSIVHPPPESA